MTGIRTAKCQKSRNLYTSFSHFIQLVFNLKIKAQITWYLFVLNVNPRTMSTGIGYAMYKLDTDSSTFNS